MLTYGVDHMKSSEQRRLDNLEVMRRIRADRKKKGLCTECNNKAEKKKNGKLARRCKTHLKIASEQYQKKRRQSESLYRNEW